MSERDTMASLDAFDEKVQNTDELRRELVEMRGGCRCHISPPCAACCTPLTMREAEFLGWEPPDDTACATPRDDAGIKSFVAPPQSVPQQTKPPRVSTVHRAWRWLA